MEFLSFLVFIFWFLVLGFWFLVFSFLVFEFLVFSFQFLVFNFKFLPCVSGGQGRWTRLVTNLTRYMQISYEQ